MKMRRILSFALALTMLLSLFCGTAYAAPRMVPVGEELAYDPLAETASIAYEQHEDGYAVTLDRAADSVTMNITAVPDSGRKAEGARLYIRTGTELKAGTAYRVSFALWSEKKIAEYTACFDGGDTASAYGKLEKRSIEAGGTDRVEYLVTPTAESGELVLRLLLGNAEAGALRFSGLAVEESSAEAMGKNVMLVDKLNLNAPGSVTIWTNDDYKAALTTSGESATMTMTEAPKAGKAVWKAKLLVSTGLKPEAGKTYRFTADVEATASRSYELCYNEGDVEKGYAVLYNQTLKVGTQKLERLIYIPNDKENAGELIVQLSLGNLLVGDQVTIRNVSVVEAIPTYTSVLSGNYSYNADFGTDIVYGDNYNVSADTTVPSGIDWGGVCVTAGGDRKGALTVDKEGGTAKLNILAGSNEAHEAKLIIDTGLTLTANTVYRVSFTLNATNHYDAGDREFHVTYGTAAAAKKYHRLDEANADGLYGLKLTNDERSAGGKTIPFFLRPAEDGGLLITLELGRTGGGANTVTVSSLDVVTVDTTGSASNVPNSVSYSQGDVYTYGSFSVGATDGYTGTLSGDNTSTVTMTCKGGVTNDADKWKRKLYIDTGYNLEEHKVYRISFDIISNAVKPYEVCYNKDGDEKGYGAESGRTTSTSLQTVTHDAYANGAGKLIIQLNLGQLDTDNTVTISNVKVQLCVMKYNWPDNDTAYVQTKGDNCTNKYTDSNKNTAVKIEISAADGDHLGMIDIKAGGILSSGNSYVVSYTIQTSKAYSVEQDSFYHVRYGRDNKENLDTSDPKYTASWDNDEFYGTREYLRTAANVATTEVYTLNNVTDTRLALQFRLGKVKDDSRDVTVSMLRVDEYDSTAGNLADVSYARGDILDLGSFHVGGDEGYKGSLSENSGGVMLTCAGSAGGVWQRLLYVDNICTLTAGKAYKLSYDVALSADVDYEALFNRDSVFKGFGGNYEPAKSGTVESTIYAYETGPLKLQFQIGKADNASTFTISNIKVEEFTELTPLTIGTFAASSIWAEMFQGYEGVVTRDGSSSATFVITNVPSDTYEDNGETKPQKQAFNAKLFVHTGVTAALESDKGYIVSFDIRASKPQDMIHAIYNNGKYANNYGWAEGDNFDGEFNKPVGTNWTTITHKVVPTASVNGGEITLQLELGLTPDMKGNSFTISNVNVKQGVASPVPEIGVTHKAASYSMQSGYRGKLDLAKDHATLNILETPSSRMEAWRTKLFVEPNVSVYKGETVRVTFDVTAEQDMDFEVCYNQDQTEKGFDAIYGLHADGGKAKTIERLFTATGRGRLVLQLSLGNVPAPNKVTVRNLKVEKVTYRDGDSALPAPLTYRTPGAVSCWAHNDYTVAVTGTDSVSTVNIVKPAANNPEPWKIKLFLDTGAVLEPGKFYKVTADLSAKMAQSYEIAYNNGGAESGYDFFGGLRLSGGGETQTVEKLLSVPADKKDAKNLMLQFNLGKTVSPNAVTISNVTVEEVALSYAEIMKGFSYQKSLSTWTDPKTSYKASLDSTDSSGTIHITDVPSSGTGVWMTKLFVRTGAMLQAGKSYQVRANLLAARAQDFEVCYNNEETEKGFDALYGQKLAAGVKTTVDKKITVPASMTDAGELVIQFSVGGAVANDITVSDVSVQEVRYGSSAETALDTVIGLRQAAQAAGTLDVSREKLSYHMTKIAADSNAVTMAGANLRAGDRYAVAFTAKADKAMNGTLTLAQAGAKAAAISQQFALTTEAQQYSFTTADGLPEGGFYDILWQFGSAGNQTPANVELSDITVFAPAERLEIMPSGQRVTVNGVEVKPDAYNINGNNYFKLRDLAMLLNGTDGQFVVRYNGQTGLVSLTTGKEYTPVGGELKVGTDKSTTCVRSPQNVSINGKEVKLKAYNIGGNNFFKLRDLGKLLNFQVDYIAATNTAVIASPLTPERQEATYAYDMFFRPEIDGESQPFVGDTMPYYEDGTYYIYYLKEGGDSYNHSVYLTTTKDFVNYTERPTPVLDASRADVQDSWIGTGSVMKADNTYYFFYTGFNASGSQEYHEKIMVAKGTSPTDFTKVAGWSITPPAELNQKNDFRDPQAYYDPATGTISLTVTASKNGAASILKYTLDKDLTNVKYDGVIFTDPTGAFWNLECSDTFQIGDKWYLTYSGQEDAVWYATADSRFGPYSEPARLDGKIFYAGKHVEDGKNAYMIGWARRSETASSTEEVSGWGGNLTVQKLSQQKDGSLSLVPVDSIASAFKQQKQLSTDTVTLTAGSDKSYKQAFTGEESYLLSGEFTYSGSGSFGLAFDFSGKEEQYKLVSVDPAEGKLKLSFNNGVTPIAETKATLAANQKHTFTYIQDGSVGIFYLDGQAALTVRLYGTTGKPIYLFAENNSVTFTSLRQFTR